MGRSSDLMAKSAPVSCETVQNPRGRARGRSSEPPALTRAQPAASRRTHLRPLFTRAEPSMLFKRLGAFTATALISFSSANNRRRPEPLAQVNDESDAPKIALTPSKDLSPAPMRLALSPLYTSHTGSRSSATVRRIVMQGWRTPGKDTPSSPQIPLSAPPPVHTSRS